IQVSVGNAVRAENDVIAGDLRTEISDGLDLARAAVVDVGVARGRRHGVQVLADEAECNGANGRRHARFIHDQCRLPGSVVYNDWTLDVRERAAAGGTAGGMAAFSAAKRCRVRRQAANGYYVLASNAVDVQETGVAGISKDIDKIVAG